MRPIKFKECNIVYAKDQSQYLQLPSHKSEDGTVTICYALSFWDWLTILFTWKVWLSVLTFNKKIMPLKIVVDKPELL